MGDVIDLHEHLENLIDKSSIPWTYAILWKRSSQRRVLKFKDGYHRGSGKETPKQVQARGSCVTITEDTTENDVASERFFIISKGQSFKVNEDLPGQALLVPIPGWINAQDTKADLKYKWGMWERTKLAHQFGIRTFLCFPLKKKRVLELASTQIITTNNPTNTHWMLYNAPLIHRIGTIAQQLLPSSPLQQQLQQLSYQQQFLSFKQQLYRYAEEQSLRYEQQLLRYKQQLLRLRDELNEEADEEAVNELKNCGKEKISDSNCSWTILTEGSDRGTDSTSSCSHDYSGPS